MLQINAASCPEAELSQGAKIKQVVSRCFMDSRGQSRPVQRLKGERAVGWDHSQGLPEPLHCDRLVWSCGALRSAWWGPSSVLGRSCLQPNPCSCQDFPRKRKSSFWASHLCQCCATSALSIFRLFCPALLLHLCTAHSAWKDLCCCFELQQVL